MSLKALPYPQTAFSDGKPKCFIQACSLQIYQITLTKAVCFIVWLQKIWTNPLKYQSHTVTQTNEPIEATVDQQLLCCVRWNDCFCLRNLVALEKTVYDFSFPLEKAVWQQGQAVKYEYSEPLDWYWFFKVTKTILMLNLQQYNAQLLTPTLLLTS